MAVPIAGLNRPPVRLEPGQGRADSALHRLTIGGKPFYILRQRGTFAEIAYDHGQLLAKEIEQGVFPEIIATVARGVDRSRAMERKIAAALYRGYTDRVLDNVSDEFRAAAEELASGYLAASTTARFSRQEVLDAIVAIEVGNLVEGFARLAEIPWARVQAIVDVAFLCLKHLDADARSFVGDARERADVQEAFARTARTLSSPNNRIDFACTGFTVPSARTADGRHLHARNLDADLYQWNAAPVLFLIDERPANAAWHQYVAFGTAGLLYPGGISGVNDAGITVSLHQLSTTRYQSTFIGRGDIAPFVQQRILREAGSLDEAIDIVRSVKHFAAWVIFCSDARSGEAARFEFNGEHVKVSKPKGMPLAQTNHFIDKDLAESTFDERDGHFTPTFGKWLETRARFAVTRDALAAPGAIDVDWAIDALASSRDGALDQTIRDQGLDGQGFSANRAYGRVPRKVYGQLGSIVCVDPSRASSADEVWMTLGESLPACHSTYVGWRVDWDAFTLVPVTDRPLRRTQAYDGAGRGDWERSLERYLWARMTAARPRDAAGELLRRDPTADEEREGLDRAEALLGSAIGLAAADGLVEVPYHYMRARIRHQKGDFAGARTDWKLLREIAAAQAGKPAMGAVWPVAAPKERPLLHDYEAALVALLSVVSEDCWTASATWLGRQGRLAEARGLFEKVKATCFPGDLPKHFDLKHWLDLLDSVETKGGHHVTLPEPNFVTVE